MHRMILYGADLDKVNSNKNHLDHILSFKPSEIRVRELKRSVKVEVTANDPVIGSYRDRSRRNDSDETVRYY